MTAPFASKMRPHLLQEMERAPLDLLIIGGGITGAGIALDAAARGMRVGLVDMQDYGAGTSSRSTKLVHGGLRYLKQLNIGIVAEVGKERAIVYENGPHVTLPERMLLPIYKEGTFGRFSTALGLKAYDYLAGVKRGERRQMLNAEQTLMKEPLLRQEGLQGGGYYVEYRTDDARLTLEVLKEAAAHGALAVNYACLERFSYEEGRVVGAEIADVLSGRVVRVRARRVVNAAGPWVDTLRQLDGSKQGKRLLLTKGVHLVVDQRRFPLSQAVYFDTQDGRMMFAIPRDGKTYIGTTDTEYAGDMTHPRMTEPDRQYLLDAVNGMFPELRVTEEDIESSWAGIRPLIYEEGKGPSEIFRKDEIWQSDSRLITIAGGKLTGYRKMAETVVDRVAAQLEEEAVKAVQDSEALEAKGANAAVAGEAVEEAEIIPPTAKTETAEEPAAAPRVSDAAGLPLEVSMPLLYAMEYEMAVTLEDFFVRRTGALLFNIDWVRKWKEPAAVYMALYLDWSAEEQARYLEQLEKQLHDAVVPEDAVEG
ncbi:glycerol-3-phosphate dehydrogenase/oxidase [Paenibacillus lentus]|uniref:Glycerol-3-phosphate dehydrogenase n=1 Tax=Paenibacillus lentus TaxID=1338368 RepID=A0A3Q8S3Z5_9BACL|nr:FAD-dependent oxidoreductase [Paenibacillus lentus]AZK45626.1 glycerol-3-phosphate dehydrogenase/oxidase [Paenibacillus lentus]